ncbi:hypothetical protein T4E_4538 [Trichinella pseudospiralis]|uniref:Uncharacterized protein n=1 Tax=Trichinella pseudospiralis TaxID=6337 RepID=A0A0V0YKJ9_TRIPS|nr:hypothetical protein T4E_4538 [Trichinella pseudospiralis]
MRPVAYCPDVPIPSLLDSLDTIVVLSEEESSKKTISDSLDPSKNAVKAYTYSMNNNFMV